MYRFVLFTVGALMVVVHSIPEGMSCERLSHGGLKCCKKDFPPCTAVDDFKECFQLNKSPTSCEVDICIAKKRGVAADDGSIDKKKLSDEVEKKFENFPELVDAVKDNCINGDLSKYGPGDICDWVKHKLCFEVELAKSCDEWNDAGDCSGMKELAEQCVKQFP